jgi:hypothetical protein
VVAEAEDLLARVAANLATIPPAVARHLVARDLERRALGLPDPPVETEAVRRARIAREHAEIRAGRWVG